MFILPKPLYHGTSTKFQDEIQLNGLGARNIVREWRVADFLTEIKKICSLSANPDLAVDAMLVDRMLKDWDKTHVSTGMNLRQGSVYLTTSLEKAKSYADSVGPEMLSYAFEVLNKCEEPDIGTTEMLISTYPEIYEWRNSLQKPIIVQVNSINLDYIREETGEKLDKNIFLSKINEKSSNEFEYSEIIPPSAINFLPGDI